MSVKIGDRFVYRSIGITKTSRLGQIETLYEVERILDTSYENTYVICKDVESPYKNILTIEDVEVMVKEFNANIERGKLINNPPNQATA